MPFAEPHIHHSLVEDDPSSGLVNGRGHLHNSSAGAASKGLSIPDRVGQLYYKHGLLCSSWPVTTITVAIIIILFSCHPLLMLPFPGNEPEESIQTHKDSGQYPAYPERWRAQQPSFYIQQVIIRSSAHPWLPELGLMDAFRGPLGEIFQVHSEVVGFHSLASNKTLRDVCLYVEGLAPDAQSFQHLLPEFSCLIVSPASLWKLDEMAFREDASFLDTIFSYKNPVVDVRSSMADLLFGVPLKDTGLKGYPVKTRSRVLTYALTIVLKSYSEPLMDELRSKLLARFPLHANQVLIFFPQDTLEFQTLTNSLLFIFL